MSNLVTTHLADDTHQNFIKSTWLKAFFTGKAAFCENMTPDTFYSNHKKIIERILKRGTVIVAQSISDPDVTVGYLVFEKPDVIHFVYVKHAFRRFGIAREMFEKSGVDQNNFTYTHRTGDCSKLIGFTKREQDTFGNWSVRVFVPGKLPKGIYNPYKMMGVTGD